MIEHAEPIKITCSAGLLSEQERQKARVALEATFDLKRGDADEFLNGSMIFCRTVANNSIAQKYKELFDNIGLQCSIDADSSIPKPTMPLSREALDKGLAEQLKKKKIPPPNGKAPASGYTLPGLFSTFKKQSVADVIQRSNRLDDIVLQRRYEAQAAAKCLYIASFFYFLSFIPLNRLINVPSIEAINTNIGYVALLAAAMFVTLGCTFLVKLKGHSPFLAALGLSGPLGLGITLLLPDKFNEKRFDFFDKGHLAGYALIVAGALWLVMPMPTNQPNIEKYLQQAQRLAQDRSTYPSQIVDNMEDMQAKEQQELLDYIDQGMWLLKRIGNNEDKTQLISDTMFLEVTKYIQWLHYQRYLSREPGKEQFSGIGDDPIRLVTRILIEQIQAETTRLGNKILNQQFQTWFKPEINPNTTQMQNLYSELVDMKLRFLRSGIDISEDFELESFELPTLTNASIVTDREIMTLRLKSSDPEIDGRDVILAFYPRNYTRQGIQGEDIAMEHIGGTLSNHLLQGQLNYYIGLIN